MYATQTYLGFTAGAARLYVYAITEGYRDERSRLLCDEFRRRVSEFGLSTGSQVAVVLPHEGYEDRTRVQVKSDTDAKMQRFYADNIAGRTPGILLTKRSVDKPEAWKGAFYIPFEGVKHPFRESKRLIDEVQRLAKDADEQGAFAQWLSRLNEFLIMRPTLFGVGLNVNQIVTSILEPRR